MEDYPYEENQEAQQPAVTPPAKKKTGLIIGIVAVVVAIAVVIALFAGNLFPRKDDDEDNGPSDSVSDDGDDDASDTPEDEDDMPADEEDDSPSSVLTGNDVFQGKRYEEMLWGYYEFENYQYSGSFDNTAEFREDMKYIGFPSQYGEKMLSALPIDMHLGRYAHFMSSFTYEGKYYNAYTEKGKAMFRKAYMEAFGDLSEEDFEKIEKIMNLMVAEVSLIFENGATQSAMFAYEIEDNMLLLYEVSIDEEFNIEMGKEPVLEYEFLHDGGKLMLAYEDVQRNYRVYGYDDTDVSLTFSGYARNKKDQYKDIEGIAAFQYNKDEPIDVYVELENGESPVDPVLEIDTETGKFTLSWEKRWTERTGYWDEMDDPTTITGTVIPCVDYGFVDYSGCILIIDGKQYRYLMSDQEYNEIHYDDLTDDEDLSESEKEELTETKNSILKDLEKAFEDAGIDIAVDYDSGKIALEANFLFDVNSYELSEDGKEYLDTFTDIYTAVVLNEDYSAYISRIVVEGHTDTNGSYSLNQTLSQNRADAVAQRCISRNAAIENVIEANGCAYDYPVYNDDGTVNMDASRRVTFRFVLTGR